VFHDDTLDRLTEHDGALASMSAAQLKALAFKATADRMMTLGELCDLVAGRATLVLEVKSHFTGDMQLAERVAAVVQGYAGPVAAMSFDPAVISGLARAAPGLPRGLVAQNRPDPEIPSGSSMRYAADAIRARPHFLAWSARDLTGVWPTLGRWAFGLPLLTWTVRSEAEQLRARRWADQMIFEGFRP
jgi:glycerophosphoryl diester phosphodiesterase